MTVLFAPDMAARPRGGGAHQRVDGAARIAFDRNGVVDLYQRAPCRLLFPAVEAGEPIQAVSITTSGGLTGGDRVSVEMRVADGAMATIATQAAEKLYRVLPGDADIRIETRVAVGKGGWAEWLGQEAILFDRSRVRRSFAADLAPGARLLAVESLVFGRGAMGERVATGAVHDGWRIRRGGRLIWADALRLEGDIAGQMAAPFGFGDATAMATVVYAGAGAAALTDLARAEISSSQPSLMGVEFGFDAGAKAPPLQGRDLGVGPVRLTESAVQVDRPHPNPSSEGEGLIQPATGTLKPDVCEPSLGRRAVLGGATSFDDMLIVRLLSSDSAALRQRVTRVAGAIRAAAGGLSPRLPAVWYC